MMSIYTAHLQWDLQADFGQFGSGGAFQRNSGQARWWTASAYILRDCGILVGWWVSAHKTLVFVGILCYNLVRRSFSWWQIPYILNEVYNAIAMFWLIHIITWVFVGRCLPFLSVDIFPGNWSQVWCCIGVVAPTGYAVPSFNIVYCRRTIGNLLGSYYNSGLPVSCYSSVGRASVLWVHV